MADTQLLRYMVFQQHEPGDAYLHNGTVHAAEAEMALMTARDVFSRRPRAVSMWVVPADEIYSMTRQEWHKEKLSAAKDGGELQETYHVFGKTYEQGQCEQFGEVEAGSHEAAMRLAINKYQDKKVLWWWVFPTVAVASTQAEDANSMFDPVLDKNYRDQSQYPVVTMMHEIRAKAGKKDG